MSPTVQPRGKLAYKFLFWFLLISLAPMGVVGWHLVNISQDILKKESLRNQETLAKSFSETVNNYIGTYKYVLSVAARLEGFSSMDPKIQYRHLNNVMQRHALLLEVSVIDLSGQEIQRVGRFLGPNPPMRNFADQPPFSETLRRGEYIGNLQRFQGLYPTLTVALPIVDTGPGGQSLTKGVLLGKVSLNGLSQMLHQQFPEMNRAQAAVVAGDDTNSFLVAHSNDKLVFSENARLPEEILKVILTQVPKKGGGEIALKDGTRVLGAYALVEALDWIVYVQQPVESAYLAATEMRNQIFRVLVWVIGVTILLSLAIAGHITQPIRALRQAADRLKAGQFEDLPEMTMTNDEIGDLAQSFLQMSESLKEKTGELVHAKDELEKFTKFLEKRVEARTRELKAAQDELINKERLAAMGQMAAVVGHEIRNPLAVINNSIFFIKTKLGKEAAAVDPKVEKHIAIIESEIKQANGIINEILTYSRTRELKLETLPLNKFLDDLLSVYPFPPHIQLAKSLDPRNPAVHIDPDQMRQAIRNLIGNGVEVMPTAGQIRVRTEVVDSNWVRIDVGDTGAGIPPDVLDKIFGAFFTTKARGTGLGLAIVRKVMDQHQGRVDVESQVGKGTVFKLYIPLAKPSSGGGRGSTLPPAPPSAPPQTIVENYGTPIPRDTRLGG